MGAQSTPDSRSGLGLGMFMMPLHPPTRSFGDTLRENAEKVLLADQLGFDEMWVGEHYSASTEPIPAPMMFMAALLERTRRIKFATGVVNLPNHHPAIVAGEAAQFDHMSEGRFIFGIGPGGLASDFELFGNTDGDARGRRMMESIDMIQKIWASEPPYRIEGEFWNVTIEDAVIPELGVGYMRKPFQQPHPPIAMSAMSPFSGSVKTAAMKGWSPVSANFIPTYSVASHWKKYCEGCEEAGREPTGSDWRVVRNIVIGESDADAEASAFSETGSNHYYFSYLAEVLRRADYMVAIKPDPNVPDDEVTTEAMMRDMVIHGSADTVLDKLIAFREEVGPFGTLMMAAMDWSGPNREAEQRSMRLLAEKVMPRLRQHVGSLR